jgi:hypothetical protein
MNILVHDDPPAVGRLVRAALSGRRHRASIAASAEEARRKLETGLFDALVIGAGGASRELAEFLETEWPDLPIVLAGVEHDVPVGGPIAASWPESSAAAPPACSSSPRRKPRSTPARSRCGAAARTRKRTWSSRTTRPAAARAMWPCASATRRRLNGSSRSLREVSHVEGNARASRGRLLPRVQARRIPRQPPPPRSGGARDQAVPLPAVRGDVRVRRRPDGQAFESEVVRHGFTPKPPSAPSPPSRSSWCPWSLGGENVGESLR